MTQTPASTAPARRRSWGLAAAVAAFGTGLTCVIGVGVVSTAIANEELAGASAVSTPEHGLSENTVYSDCDITGQDPGFAVMQCQSPTSTEIRLSGAAATSVTSDPTANWSIPVEDYVDETERGYAYFEIGQPYRTIG